MDRGVSELDATVFEKDDLVLISYPQRPPSKLHMPWRGPFVVKEKSFGNTYYCENLSTRKTIQVDISRMKPYHADPGMSDSEVAVRDNFGEFVVKEILDVKGNTKRDLEFLVSWEGFDSEWDTWEPYGIVKDLEALDCFCRKVSPKLDFLL